MAIPGIPNPALGRDTGASGFIGSHVADQTLTAGYRVRGTTRDVSKNRWLEDYFRSKYSDDKFHLVAVSDMEAPDAFDEAVLDAAGFIHVANDMTGSRDPAIAIPRAVNGALNAAKASAKWVKKLWDHDYDALKGTPPQHFINVQDDARLHVIGLVHPQLRGERLFAVAAPVSLRDIVEILRRSYPFKHWDDFPDDEKDLSTFEPSKRAEQLLVEAYGAGFTGLEESVKGNAADLVAGMGR